MDRKLLDILVCPATRQPLSILESAGLDALNRAIAAGGVTRGDGSDQSESLREALVTRGETQALVAATLGTERDAQRIDALAGDFEDRFMLHYNMPPFATGETGRVGA